MVTTNLVFLLMKYAWYASAFRDVGSQWIVQTHLISFFSIV